MPGSTVSQPKQDAFMLVKPVSSEQRRRDYDT